jgi:hypothetical protein
MATVDQIRNSAVVTRTTIVIDSKFRTSGSSSDFNMDLGVTITDIKLIDIRAINFVNVVNNVNEDNHFINWVDGLGVTHNDELTNGNYVDTTLCEAISTLLTENTTAAEFYTCSVDRVNNTFILENGTGNVFDLNFGISGDTSIGNIIGFGTTNYSGITSQTGPELLNLYPSRSLYIGSTAISNNATDNILLFNGVDDAIIKLDIKGIFGSIQTSERVIEIKQNDPTLTNIDIRLYDDNGDIIILPSDSTNGYFSITVDIYSGIFDLTYYD